MLTILLYTFKTVEMFPFETKLYIFKATLILSNINIKNIKKNLVYLWLNISSFQGIQ